MFEFFEILFLSRIASNTAISAQTAMPEFVKEANWIAEGLYPQIRRDSGGRRFVINSVMFTATFFLSLRAMHQEVDADVIHVWVWLGVLLFWLFMAGASKARAQNQAMQAAWASINEKKMKEDIIRDTMYQAAQVRLRLQ